jgi:hypothetical protein
VRPNFKENAVNLCLFYLLMRYKTSLGIDIIAQPIHIYLSMLHCEANAVSYFS